MNNPKKAIIRNGAIVYGDDITAEHLGISSTEANSRREAMKTKHRKDLLQRNEVGYYRAYPEQAKNLSDETRRLLS